MVPNKPLRMLIIALCLIIPASLWAQTKESHFVQRLTWVGDEYAIRYEVTIEKEEDGEYKKVLQEFTTVFFIEVSLPHGKYRYQVIPYDFFGYPVPETEWMDFEVKSLATIMVNQDKPESKIENKNQFDIYLGLTWLPILLIYGRNESFGENLSPYGAGLRLVIFSAEQKSFNFGMEGISSWRISSGDQSVQSLTFDLNIAARFSNDKAALNCRMGAGFSMGIGTNPEAASGHANFGVSFILLFLKRLYLEFGMDYVQFFSNSGFLCPSVGLGYKF